MLEPEVLVGSIQSEGWTLRIEVPLRIKVMLSAGAAGSLEGFAGPQPVLSVSN